MFGSLTPTARLSVSLLRLENKQEESIALLHRLSKLSFTEEDKADESKLLATIQFQDLLKRFSSDPVLGMLPDSGKLWTTYSAY